MVKDIKLNMPGGNKASVFQKTSPLPVITQPLKKHPKQNADASEEKPFINTSINKPNNCDIESPCPREREGDGI